MKLVPVTSQGHGLPLFQVPLEKKKIPFHSTADDFLYLPPLCCWGRSAHWEQRRSTTHTEGVKWPGNWLSRCPRKTLRRFFFP